MLSPATSTPSKPHPTSPPKQVFPGLHHQPLRAVLAELADFIVLEHAEGFAGVVGAHKAGWVKDIAQFVSSEAVEVGIVGVEFGSELGSAFWFEDEGWTFVADILGPGLEIVAGVGELEDAELDEVDSGGVVGRWGQKRELLQIGIGEMGSTNLGSGTKVERQGLPVCQEADLLIQFFR